jgi:tRNA dimethylallyltransferase
MNILAIFGPTGSGKTDIAVHAARALGTEVVNCDPAQCYRGLPILTNKPGPEHDAIAPHRLIGIWGLDELASVAAFAQRAHETIDDLLHTTGSAVLCGGSGLYMLAALTEMSFAQVDADEGLRERLHEEYETLGSDRLHARLAGRDPAVAARIHPNDRKRLIRALETSERNETLSPEGRSIWDAPMRRPTRLAGLRVDRELIRAGIDRRTAAMFDRGVIEEVAAVVGERAERLDLLSVTARRLHGLQDCADALAGRIERSQALERMATRTRQYAKRQDTWARRW